MKKTKINRPVKLSLLTEELFDAFPEWTYPDPLPEPLSPGLMLTDVVISEEEISYPDTTDESAVLAVIGAHDPTGESANERKERKKKELKEKIKKAETVAELRAAVLEFMEAE